MKRYNIAMFNDSFRFDYNLEMVRGAAIAIKECGHHLIHVPMMAPTDDVDQVNAYFRRMTDFLVDMNADGFILPVGTLRSGRLVEGAAVDYMLEHIDHSKILCIEDHIAGIRSIAKDNGTGMRELMIHLLDHHHFRHVGLVEGPANSVGSQERHYVCVEELAKRHLSYVMTRGNFRGNNRQIIREFLDENPHLDVLVCFSDQIAINAYEVAKERGLRIGKDIAISGFDDIPSAALMDPSLTTVSIEPYEFGYAAGKEMVNLLDGKPQQITTFSSHFVHRMSCGEKEMPESEEFDQLLQRDVFPHQEITDCIYRSCTSGYHQELYQAINHLVSISEHIATAHAQRNGEDLIRKILQYEEQDYFNLSKFYETLMHYYQVLQKSDRYYKTSNEIVKYQQVFAKYFYRRHTEQIKKSAQKQTDIYQIILKASAFEKNPDAAYYEMFKSIDQLGYKFAGIYIFDKGADISQRAEEDLYFKAELLDGRIQVHPQRLREPGFILSEFGQNHPHTYTVAGLMADRSLLGFLVLEASHYDLQNVFFMSLELGLAIKYLKMFKVQNELLKTLANRNVSLHFQAAYDELTGLLNRRGLQEKSTELFNIYQGMHVYIYSIDLDRLKYINDNYGHAEGDFAIKKIAEALHHSFRQTDLIGRIGGDEFLVVAIKPHSDEDYVIKRINLYLEDFNRLGEKAYPIRVSIGYSEFDVTKHMDMALYLKEADERLYEVKKLKKVSRID